MIAAVRVRDRGLRVAAHRADYGRAEVLRPLTHDQADTAGRGVDQNRVAGCHLVGLEQKRARGHAADHHRRRQARIDAVRQRDHARGGHDPGRA